MTIGVLGAEIAENGIPAGVVEVMNAAYNASPEFCRNGKLGINSTAVPCEFVFNVPRLLTISAGQHDGSIVH